PQERAVQEQAIDVQLELRNALRPLGEYERQLTRLREAEALAETLGDQRRLGRVLSHMGNCFYQTGEYERAVDVGERALRLPAALEDVALRAGTNAGLAGAYTMLGEYGRAIECATRIIASLAEDLLLGSLDGMLAPPSLEARTWMAWCLAEQGHF